MYCAVVKYIYTEGCSCKIQFFIYYSKEKYIIVLFFTLQKKNVGLIYCILEINFSYLVNSSVYLHGVNETQRKKLKII